MVGLAELERLDFGAQGAVEHQDGLAGTAAQLGFDRGWGDGFHYRYARLDLSSWPRSSRPSTSFAPRAVEGVDGLDKPGHDPVYNVFVLTRPSPRTPARRAGDRSRTPRRRGPWRRNDNPLRRH